MDDNDISKLVMANMLVAGRNIGFLNRGRPASKKTKLVLPPRITREMGKMGPDLQVRALQRMIRGTDWQAREHFRRPRILREVFLSVLPQVETKLIRRTVEALLESVFYSQVLSGNVREILNLTGARKADRLNLVLNEIQDVALRGLRKRSKAFNETYHNLQKN